VLWSIIFPAGRSARTLGREYRRNHIGHAWGLSFLFILYVRDARTPPLCLLACTDAAFFTQPLVWGLAEVGAAVASRRARRVARCSPCPSPPLLAGQQRHHCLE